MVQLAVADELDQLLYEIVGDQTTTPYERSERHALVSTLGKTRADLSKVHAFLGDHRRYFDDPNRLQDFAHRIRHKLGNDVSYLGRASLTPEQQLRLLEIDSEIAKVCNSLLIDPKIDPKKKEWVFSQYSAGSSK